ncbi:TonB-dependent receptor [bacterium]|nr:MAG: TonB-dependent receptor [bacterium]
MKAFLIFLFLISLFIESSAQQQTISGTVKDALSLEGLPGANVSLQPGNYGAATDLDGNFKLTNIPYGRYTVTVSFVGFQSKVLQAVEVNSAKQVILEFLLEEEVYTSEGITITAQPNRAEVQNLFTQVSAISFSVEETRRFAGAMDDPLRAAAVFPGVVQSGDVNSNGIVVRGNSPKGLQWRLNGVRIPNPNHFGNVGRSDGGVTLFSTQLLANSDFLTSAFPAEYGNASSGIFDIRYRKGNANQREHTVQVGINGIDLATEGPLGSGGSSSYLINYRYSIFGFLQYIEPDMKGKVPQYQDVNFQFDWQTEKWGNFTFFGVGGMDESSAKPEPDGDFTLEERMDQRLDNNVGVLGLQHSYSLSKRAALQTTLSFVGRQVDFRDGMRDSVFTYQPLSNVSQLNYTWAIEQSVTQKLFEHGLMQIGYRAALDGFETTISETLTQQNGLESIADDNGTTQNLETYIQTKWNLSPQLSINTGIHSMYYRLTDSFTLEPRISAKYLFTNGNSFALAYGNHAQLEDISVYSMNLNGASNSDLKPGRAHHFSSTYSFGLSDNLHAQVDAYYQYLYDIPIVFGSYKSLINHAGGVVTDSYINNGKTYSYGLELMIEHFFKTDYYYLTTVSWNNSRYRDGSDIWRTSRYSSGLTLTALGGKEWRFTENNSLSLNIRATHTLGEYYIPVDVSASKQAGVEVMNANTVYQERLPNFIYVDFSLGYKSNYAKSSGEWSIQIKNMLNQRPIIGYSYNSVTETVEEMKPLGIIPILAYRYNF